MTIACYCRVSSAKQAETNSVTAQRYAIEKYLRAKGIEPESCKWYIDEAFTGRNMNRPAWEALREACRKGEVRTMYAYDLMRCGRSVADVGAWIEEVIRVGTNVDLVSGKFDLNSPWGKAMAQVAAVFAELDVAFKAEQCRNGIRAQIAAGAKWGGQKVKLGAKGGPKLTQEDRETIRKDHAQGVSAADLAKRYGVIPKTIYRHLAPKNALDPATATAAPEAGR